MHGQMMNMPLLISAQIEFAWRFQSSAEVVTRTVEGPIHRSTWGEVARRARKLANALQKMGICVADSYVEREKDDTHHDGWFVTGAIGTVEGDGYLHVTDRSKDVIKSRGEWVSSIDLENAAMMHPGVQHAAAIPRPKWLERPLLIVVQAPGKEVKKEELQVLKRELRQKFADYKLHA